MRLLKNLLFLVAAELVSKVMSFAAFAYLARTFGPDGFGYVEFSGAVLLCAGLIVDQGFGQYGAREIAKNPSETPGLARQIIAARSVLAIGAYAGVVAMAVLTDRPAVVTQLLLVYGLSLLFMPLLLQWVFQGHDSMQLVAAAQLIRQSVFALAVFLLIRGPFHIWLVALAEVAAVSCASAYCVWVYWRRFGNPFPSRLRLSRQLVREGVPIGLSQMFWVVKMFGATVILGLIATAQDVGYFAAAMRILIALHTFVWLYYFNLLPSMSRAWQEGGDKFAALVKRSLHTVAWIWAGGGLIWVLVAPAVVKGMYGPAFLPAGSSLQWLAAMCAMAAISGHYRFGLIASGRQTAEMVTAALGAVSAAILIPIGYAKIGPEGAAMALCVAELIVWVSSWWCSHQMLGLRGHGKLLIRPILAAAFTAGMLSLLPVSFWAAQALLVGVLITALAFALDVVVRDEFRSLLLVRRRRPEWLSKRLPEATQ